MKRFPGMKDNLPWVNKAELTGKKVLVRGDLDVDDADNPRANSVRQMIVFLRQKGADKIKVIGHSETRVPLINMLRNEYVGVEFDDKLRDNGGEKLNDESFAKSLAEGWEVYVNEAFATSHRRHASISALPQVMRRDGKEVYLGLRFEKEVEMLSGIWEKAGRRILVIGGVKVSDKEKFARDFKDKFAAVLTGGMISGVKLRPDGLDISDEVIAGYVQEIATAEVILAAGVMGKYEDPGAEKGTKAILEAIAGNQKAYKVAGGGDIEMAISKYGLTDKFNWISVGGGAMLEYLGTGTLPGIEAVLK
ncbi:MAG: Phosphoglycerate kinase [Candidatus Amesbacteria bacterium GW2011_GWB1_47_19]|nr:MAG: Phosphoglycerate kinase [Candidatus Amesbacteria bacterium GW2011_GWA1_44_24]KKU31829.1 MAG: phosphoglycerate kinase, phosphoglycerate kinase [Candidatus Amesbacteria bacterium GW2011_GWC1_46_24]KKU66765.1 MAG: Phosphoglycerate kinase [Candidatus Amesbacteria bacterium GW2011_GWB1_47_19]